MWSVVADALALLSGPQRRRFYGLVVVSSLAAVAQVLAVFSIMPFIVLLTDPALAGSHSALLWIQNRIGVTGYAEFLTVFGLFAILALGIGNAILALEHWLASRLLLSVGWQLQVNVLRKCLTRPFEYFLTQQSGRLADLVLTQVERVVEGVLGQVLVIVSNFTLILLVVVALVVVSPATTLVTLMVLTVLFGVVFLVVRPRIHAHGVELTARSAEMHGAVRETFDGVREIKLRRAENYFAGRFSRPAQDVARLSHRYGLLSTLPNVAIEALVFAGLIAIALAFVAATDDPGLTLSLIALYGIAAYRLVPAMQGLFIGLSTIQHDADAVDVVAEQIHLPEPGESTSRPLDAPKSIGLQGVALRYPDSDEYVVEHADLTVELGQTVCLFGPSGSGKSTVINLLSGLLEPTDGTLLYNGRGLGPPDYARLQAMVGLCPQKVFLFDASLIENIAFGLDAGEVDQARIARVMTMAALQELASSEGLRAVAEQGRNLSGGQAQRVGIARAMYPDPAILFFDEAFSGLDAANRDRILDTLFELQGKAIIFASHDPSLAARCGRVLTIRAGRLVDVDPAALSN